MTRTEKILTAALFRCAQALVLALDDGPEDPDKAETNACAIAAMNASLVCVRRDLPAWLELLDEGNREYLRMGGKDIFELGGKDHDV